MKRRNRILCMILTAVMAFGLCSVSAGETAGEPQTSQPAFFTPEVNRMIDENYQLVLENGWAELRIPKSVHGIGFEVFSANALDAAEKLIDAGYEAYCVGGTIRDLVMGSPSADFDITTTASNEEIAALFGDVAFHSIPSGAEFAFVHYPDAVIRALRFKARYGFRFSDRVEKELRKNCAKYLKLITPLIMTPQLARMFNLGFAQKSLEVLYDYGVFTTVFPALADVEDTEALKAYEQEVAEELDRLYAEGEKILNKTFLSRILLPAVEEAEKTMTPEEAVLYTLGRQAVVFRFAGGILRETIEMMLNLTEEPDAA